MIHSAGLILNQHNPQAVHCAERASAFFSAHGVSALTPQRDGFSSVPELIVTFGGDGTLLLGARYAMEYGIPLLGINLGTVGFLTEEDPKNLERALEDVLFERYQLEERSLLHVSVPKSGEEYYALNDAVITRGGYARLIQVDAFINQSIYGVFTADGIIVATPTGSTGYSLSAGGPIVEPGMNCMIVTPVCAHSMQHCPCVVSDRSRIRLLLNPQREQTAELQIDGQNKGTLRAGDEIRITGTDQKIRLIRFREYDFLGLMRRKLIEWGI